MRSPLVTRKSHERKVDALLTELEKACGENANLRDEAARWRVEYRKIRDRIVDIATHPGATPQIKATLAEFTGFRP